MEQRCFITWSSQPPPVINFNPTQSYYFGYGIASGPERTSNHQDAISVANCLVSNEILPANNVLTFTNNSIDFSDSYTSIKLEKAFKFQASNVESDGIFIFYYSGPGHKIGEDRWSLASTNFDARNPTTHITADSLINWLVQASSSKAKFVLAILNCSQGGAAIAAALTDRSRNHSGLGICVLSTNDDPLPLFTSLDTSVSTHFLCTAISKLRAGPGLLQLTNVYDFTARCSEAFFKLILNYDPAAKRVIDSYDAQPTLSALGKPRLVEIGPSEETDIGPPGALPFLAKFFTDGMTGVPLPQNAYDWLQRIGDVAAGPLADLLRLGVLGNDAVTCAALCVMTQAMASLQIAFGGTTEGGMDSTNLLLVTFTAVAATVSSVARNLVELEQRHFKLSWKSYCETMEKHGFPVPKMREMMKAKPDDTPPASVK